MTYHVRKISAFSIFLTIGLMMFGVFLNFFAFNPVMGVIFLVAGLVYAWYLIVWKLEFNTNTGEFHCRTLFYSQEFHVSDIRWFCTTSRKKTLEIQFEIHIKKDDICQKIRIPVRNAKPLKQYLERYERKKTKYEKPFVC